jgi:hypothetical protein
MQLYQFYLPDELPEFDSYRVTSISADVECLLRRIAALVPPHYKPGDTFSILYFVFKKEKPCKKIYAVCYCELIYCFSHLVGVDETQ